MILLVLIAAVIVGFVVRPRFMIDLIVATLRGIVSLAADVVALLFAWI